ncbi:hypothetical protein PENTCL1PPCAC_27406, partial [Pristionchus entomophagus]
RKGKCLGSSLSSHASSTMSLITGTHREDWYTCSFARSFLVGTHTFFRPDSVVIFSPRKAAFVIVSFSAIGIFACCSNLFKFSSVIPFLLRMYSRMSLSRSSCLTAGSMSKGTINFIASF